MVFYSIKATLYNHQNTRSVLIAPLLQSSKRYYCKTVVEVLACKSGAMTP